MARQWLEQLQLTAKQTPQFALKMAQNLHLTCDFSFFEDYFTTWRSLQPGHNAHSTAKWKIHLYKGLLLVSAFNCVLFYLLQDSWSPMSNTVQCNVPYLSGFRGYINLFLAAFLLLAHYFYVLMYQHNFGFTSKWMYQILIRQNHCAFLWKYLKSKKEIAAIKKRNPDFKPQTIAEQIHQLAISSRSQYQILYFCSLLQYIIVQHEAWHQFTAHCPLYFSATCQVKYLLFQVITTLRFFIFHLLIHTQILTALFGLIILVVMQIRLHQIDRFVNDKVAKSSKRQPTTLIQTDRLTQFFRLNNQTLQYFEDCNAVYGRALFAMLLVGIPSNALFVMAVTLFTLKYAVKLILIVLIVLQIFALIGIHLWAAYVSIKFHQPAKVFWQFCCTTKNVQQRHRLYVQLKIARHIELYNTAKPFTINYGKYGQITFASFGRHLFYYCKILCFVYKLLQVDL